MKFATLKKSLLTLTLVAVTTLAPIQKSHAIVAICSWNPMMIGAGILMAGGGGLLGAGSAELANRGGKVGLIGSYILGAPAVVIGFLGMTLLADESATMEFQKVGPSEYAALGVTQRQAQVYNSELDQVNMVMQQVTSEVNQIEKPTAQDVANIFDRYEHDLSPETLKVMRTISLKLLEVK